MEGINKKKRLEYFTCLETCYIGKKKFTKRNKKKLKSEIKSISFRTEKSSLYLKIITVKYCDQNKLKIYSN